jgi:MFS family permease
LDSSRVSGCTGNGKDVMMMPQLFFRPLAVLCVCAASWAFNFGLGAPLTSLWLRDANEAETIHGLTIVSQSLGGIDTVIGLNTGIYYLGIALAAAVVPGMMRRWGSGCPAAGMFLSGLVVALLPWSGHIGVWFLLRFVHGIAGAMSLVPLETFVNRESAADVRARNFGYYAFSVALGWALGNLVGLQMYEETPGLALVIGGLAGFVAGGILLGFLSWPAEPKASRTTAGSIPLRRHFLSYGSAWSQGFLEGGMVAFLAVYLLFLGLSENRVSWLTSGIMVGVILFQVPVAWLADRLGRTAVLLGCYAVSGMGLAFLTVCGDSVWLMLWLFLVGACSGAFYPLGLAILGEDVPENQLARASAWYLAINCCGSLIGPVVSGMAMDRFGKPAMFVMALAALAVVLIGWGVSRRGLQTALARDVISRDGVAEREAA